MKRITLKQGSNKIVIFVDKITYLIKQGSSNDCTVFLGNQGITVNHTIEEIEEMIENIDAINDMPPERY